MSIVALAAIVSGDARIPSPRMVQVVLEHARVMLDSREGEFFVASMTPEETTTPAHAATVVQLEGRRAQLETGVLAPSNSSVNASSSSSGRIRTRHWEEATAATALVTARLVTRFLRFRHYQRLLRGAGLAQRLLGRARVGPQPSLEHKAWVLDDSVVHSFTAVTCLERSLALALLARLSGVSVEWCLGVAHPPFEAHAWIEHQGRPIGEMSARIERLTVMLRA